MRRLLIATTLALTAAPAFAASYDCTRARAADEKAICADRSLNDKDVRMALLFELDQRFLPMGGRDSLRDAQSAWLKKRHGCGANRQCLARSYDGRIAALRAVIDDRVYPHGPF
jgi:uncharacterized protein